MEPTARAGNGKNPASRRAYRQMRARARTKSVWSRKATVLGKRLGV